MSQPYLARQNFTNACNNVISKMGDKHHELTSFYNLCKKNNLQGHKTFEFYTSGAIGDDPQIYALFRMPTLIQDKYEYIPVTMKEMEAMKASITSFEGQKIRSDVRLFAARMESYQRWESKMQASAPVSTSRPMARHVLSRAM